jgi:enoyl-CoA hydratase
LIECGQQDRVVTIAIDRPDKRNALNAAVCEQISGAVESAVIGGARALVLTGNGTSFCSGADLDEVHTDQFRTSLYRMLRAVLDVPIPVVAAVNGPAVGAGTQLAIAVDLRVVCPTAFFALPTARLGLAVDPWTIRRLVQLAGHGPSAALLLACEQLGAAEALACGLANYAGDHADALARAHRLAEFAPLTLAYNKAVLNALCERDVDEAELMSAFDRCWSSIDLTEGQRARGEKRSPVFRGE